MSEQRVGAYYALGAYLFWGVAPVYFVWVSFAQPLEILAERIVWSLPLLVLLVSLARGWQQLSAVTRKDVLVLGACSLLLSINWLTFIYAIYIGNIAETSLGYFINPLVSIVLGRLFLGEPMRRLQWLATGLAALGVCVELFSLGVVPWLGLALAFSFGFYGLARKQIQLAAPLALGIETLMVFPLALGYLFWFDLPQRSVTEASLLALGGLVTVIPLVCFGAAARRLPLTTLGFYQYIAPSLSLFLAIYVYHEDVPLERWINLSLIWLGLAVYSLESMYQQRRLQFTP